MPAGFMLPPGYTLRQLQEKNKSTKVSLWIGTRAEFAALGSADADTIYIFTDDPHADALNTLCITDETSGDYVNVYLNNSGVEVASNVYAGLYSVYVYVSAGLNTSCATVMMGLTGTSNCDSAVFPYTNANGSTQYAVIRAEKVSGSRAFRLRGRPLNDTTTTYKNFSISVRRIGSVLST